MLALLNLSAYAHNRCLLNVGNTKVLIEKLMNKTLIGKLNAISVYLTWVGFFSIFIIMFGVFLEIDILKNIGIYLIWFLFIFGPVHFILAYFTRCPYCNKCLTVEGFQTPHHNSRPVTGLNGWASVIVHWFSGSVVCIHCGKEVDTNAL